MSDQWQAEYDFDCPVSIHAGNLALDHLPFELSMVGAGKPLILIDRQGDGALHRLEKQIIAAFQSSAMQPSLMTPGAAGPDRWANARQVVEQYARIGADALVVVGAGEIVDQAKLARGLLSVAGQVDRLSVNDLTQIQSRPDIALIWAAGPGVDGREASGWIGRPGDASVFCQALTPDLVIIDPRLLDAMHTREQLPGWLNALVWAIQAQAFGPGNPFSGMYAKTAVAGIWPHLSFAAGSRMTKKTCTSMVTAVICAGFGLSPTAQRPVSALGRAVSVIGRMAPGIADMILLPYVVAHDAVAVSDRLPDFLTAIIGADKAALAAPHRHGVEVLRQLYDLPEMLHAASGGRFPRTLQEAGLPRFLFDEVIELAMPASDRGRLSAETMLAALDAAWAGKPVIN